MADAAAAYAGLAPGIKLAVAAGMVLGRIEILAALAVLTPVFWRR
jgi:Trk-type K+ transport system membrane component